MKSKMKNKRGDIPVTILVIMVFVLLTTALVSFLISDTRTASSFANLGVFENLTSNLNEFYFYVNSGMPINQAANLVGGKFNVSTDQLTLHQEDKGKLNVTYTINVGK